MDANNAHNNQTISMAVITSDSDRAEHCTVFASAARTHCLPLIVFQLCAIDSIVVFLVELLR